jgi:aminomethyltransferase
MLKTTPFHERTAALCASHAWRRWAGCIVASSYELTHEREYHVIRAAAALFDVSPLYKYLVRGRDAARLLDIVVTRNVHKASVGQVLYTTWCDHAGKVLDDGTVARLDETSFRLTAAEPNLRWLEDVARGMQVDITDISDSVAALALQGPTAWSILQSLGAPPLKYFRVAPATLAGIPVSISRTGYTGDLGYEIWADRAHAIALWDALIDAGRPYGIMPAGMLALDMARVEAGLMLIDVDYVPARKALIESQLSSPYELDLARTVDLGKERFIGRDALAAEAKHEARWQFVGIELDFQSLERAYAERGLATRLPNAAWRMSVPIYVAGGQAGYATSGMWSPLLKKYIALAHLRARWAAPGTRIEMELTIEHRRKYVLGHVAKKPFFDPPRKRA